MPKTSNLNAIGAQLKKATSNKASIVNVQPEAPAPHSTSIGRRKRLATKRENAITVYCTDEMMNMLNEIKYNNRIERQRVIQTALYEFLQKYYSNSICALDQDGFHKVRDFEHLINLSEE